MGKIESVLKQNLAVPLCIAVQLVCAGCSQKLDHTPVGAQQTPTRMKAEQTIRVSSEDTDAAEPAIASSPDGSVYVAWVDHFQKAQADVMLARFTAEGQMKGSPVRVNSQPGAATAWQGDPPTIVVAPDHTVLVGWTARAEPEAGHATVLYLSASRDNGQTFDLPVKVNDDPGPAEHGMHSLAVGSDGRVYVAWLDERNVRPMPMKDMKMDAKSSGHHMESNRELFFSSSSDGGRTFSANQSVAKEVCPCCKTALAVGTDGRVYLGWRQVLPGDFRHIAVSSSADGGKSFTDRVIVSDDQWMLKGCPVSGAGLMAEGDQHLRVVWYAGREDNQQGVYWSESNDGGKTFQPRTLVASGFSNGTPVLLSRGQNVSLAIWESTANGASEVRGATVGKNQGSVDASVLANKASLPAAVVQNDQVLLAYVVKEGEKRSIWLQTNRGFESR